MYPYQFAQSMKKFFFLIVVYLALQYAIQHVIISDELIFDSLADQISYERIVEFLDEGKNWKWLSYALLPLIVSIKIFVVATCFKTGNLFLNTDIPFGRFLSIVTNGEFVFVIPTCIKFVWYAFFSSSFSLQDLQYFSPLSIFSLFNPAEVEPWLMYPLQLLNLFEVAYWCVLAWQLKSIFGKDFSDCLGFVASTYGLGLFVWVIFVMFLIVSFS